MITGKVYFVGAGPGAPDLITVRGAGLLKEADAIIYAGSLINTELLKSAKSGCRLFDSAKMSLPEVIARINEETAQGHTVVRLHSGDPSVYGAIREQMDALDEAGISYEVCPGVSSFCGAAAALKAEYTLPGVSQTVILTRMEGRTPVPAGERLELLASHGATMAIFLSAGMTQEVRSALLAGGYAPETPCAIVYKATWPDEKIVRGKLADLKQMAEGAGIRKTALILVGGFLGSDYELSKLYDENFTTEFRAGKNVHME
ncbi:MAG: precorrin-4 C(11)-methyltransferase [Lachnospiraceae bacterium]|nr:precorrin-4 C(11)-methyltransferase [Lachnospiraceae bacterium]